MNTLINELKNGALVLVLVILMSLVVVTAGAAVGTFTFRTSGASDTVEAVDLVYPQRVPETDSVTTESIADGSVTPAKISSGYNLLTTAEKTQALVGSNASDYAVTCATTSQTIAHNTTTRIGFPSNNFNLHTFDPSGYLTASTTYSLPKIGKYLVTTSVYCAATASGPAVLSITSSGFSVVSSFKYLEIGNNTISAVAIVNVATAPATLYAEITQTTGATITTGFANTRLSSVYLGR